MYQQDLNNEQNVQTPPPSYLESASTQHLSHNPQQNNPQHDNPNQAYQAYTHSQYAPQVPTQVIVVQAPTLPPLGPRSVEVNCPKCKANVMTSVEEGSADAAYYVCVILCLFGCLCFSFLPFCMDKFKNYKHTCPRCNTFFGTFNPS